jgi:dynactin complex subunit
VKAESHLIHKVKKDHVVNINNNAYEEVDGNNVCIVHKNKSDTVKGTLQLTRGNKFETISGVENKTIVHDQTVTIQGNQNLTVEKNLTQHCNQDITLSSERTITFNAPEKKLIGGYTILDTVILTSPDGNRWGLLVDNNGQLKAALLSED